MNITAALLAGGESSRMGRDKAALRFRGKPLWQIQFETLRKLEPIEIFVSARSDPPWRPADAVFVPDDLPSRGPLSGIAASLGQMHSTHLLVLAIDMPRMRQAYLRALCARAAPGCGVIARSDDCFEPLAAIYPRQALVECRQALSGSDFSLQTVTTKLVALGQLRAIAVTEREKELFRNVNAPADLQSA